MRLVRWTKEDIICAIQLWAEEYGAPPAASAWKATGGEWPNSSTVASRFGSWNAAIVAAGFETSKWSEPRFDRDEARRLRAKGLNNSEIARTLGVYSSAITEAIGTTPRPTGVHAGRHRSRERRIADLKKALAKEENDG